MTYSRRSTRQRLVQAALQLFAAQGITETTTRQIADLAEVNEVTLFRHFGSKYGLLLAVMEDMVVFAQLGEILGQQANQINSIPEALETYTSIGLQALEQVPDLVRSLIGEAGQYPPENRRALGRGLTQANRYTAQYLTTVLHHHHLQSQIPVEKLASLLNSLLLGYVVLKLTSDDDELWRDRDDLSSEVVNLFLHGAISQANAGTVPFHQNQIASRAVLPDLPDVADLPASLVHTIFKHARKAGIQDYAMTYVLFGAGVSAREMTWMERSHSISTDQQHILQIPQGQVRQVPLNQWILGRRYGSHPTNPLSRWLKTRKDNQAALFLNEAGNPISEVEIRLRWQGWVEGLVSPEGQHPLIKQAQHTWCVEMLMRGISLEDLSILTGRDATELQPYVRRAREKTALERAIRLDQKPAPANSLEDHPQMQSDMPT